MKLFRKCVLGVFTTIGAVTVLCSLMPIAEHWSLYRRIRNAEGRWSDYVKSAKHQLPVCEAFTRDFNELEKGFVPFPKGHPLEDFRHPTDRAAAVKLQALVLSFPGTAVELEKLTQEMWAAGASYPYDVRSLYELPGCAPIALYNSVKGLVYAGEAGLIPKAEQGPAARRILTLARHELEREPSAIKVLIVQAMMDLLMERKWISVSEGLRVALANSAVEAQLLKRSIRALSAEASMAKQLGALLFKKYYQHDFLSREIALTLPVAKRMQGLLAVLAPQTAYQQWP